MTFLFGNFVLWPFLILAAVPLLLHLFARSRPPVYSFSSVEFIRRIVRSTIRIKRPRDWLLLLVRTLLFAAVILLFLRPVFFSGQKLADPFRKKNVVLIVDATASMAYPEGAQTRFAAACAEASEILAGLSSRDSANIIWLKAVPEMVFPEMGVNFNFLHDALRRKAVTIEAGDITKALSMAVSLLEPQEGRREVCIVSDFQKSVWDNVRAEMPAGIDLIKVKVGAGDGANQTLADIHMDPSRPLAGEDTTVYCDVHNYSSQPMRKTVFLSVGESRLSQDVMVPAWNKITAVFKHRFAEPGVYPLVSHLSEDVFPADDRRATVVQVHEFLRVGILPSEPATASAWRRALNAVGWIKVELLTDKQLSGDLPFDAVLLSGWNGAEADRLRQILQTGCAVICYPAGSLPLSHLAALINGPGPQSDDLFQWELGNAAYTLKVTREKDELFRLFTGGEFGDFSQVAFRGRLVFSAASLPAGENLMTYDDQIPALTRFPTGKGLFYLWNMPLNSEISNWTKRADFVPFLCELLLVSRRKSNNDHSLVHAVTGEKLMLNLNRDVPRSELALRSETGQEVRLSEFRSAGNLTLVADQPLSPGIYSWRHMDKPLAWTAVNFPVIESDLRAILLQDMETTSPAAAAVSRGFAVRRLRDGLPLWPYLLAFGLIAVLAEGAAALWADRS